VVERAIGDKRHRILYNHQGDQLLSIQDTSHERITAMRFIAEKQVTIHGDYATVFQLCIECLTSIQPALACPAFHVDGSSPESGKIRGVSIYQSWANRTKVFSSFVHYTRTYILEISITQTTMRELNILVRSGIEGSALLDIFGISKRIVNKFISLLIARTSARGGKVASAS
jgi:hypothetical protein